MTKNGAIAKAKRYAERLQNTSVIEKNGEYDVTHTDYVEEWIEDGWNVVCNYKYDYELIKY